MLRIVSVLGFVLVVVPALAGVPIDPPTSSTLEIAVTCTEASPTTIEVELVIAEDFDDGVQGLRIERTVLGVCGSTEIIASTQFDLLATGLHTFFWTDDTASSAFAYRYRVIGLDAQGDELPFFGSSFDLVSPIVAPPQVA